MSNSTVPANPFYLVKIIDRQWAEKLMDGEFFMKPLSSFGDLARRDASSSNDFRGDVLEGVSHSFSDREKSPFFRDVIRETESQPRGLGQIAEYLLQERIYCLYCLEFSEGQSSFIPPDERLLDFGDTAVIIFDPMLVLRRLFDEMLRFYENSFWVGAKRVQYSVDLTAFTEYDEFTKAKRYSWQNEFRIALDVSNGMADKQAWEDMTDLCRIMFSNQGGRVDTTAERKPIVLTIGDIREACVAISTSDLIALNLPLSELKVKPTVLRPVEPPRPPVVTSYKPVMVR